MAHFMAVIQGNKGEASRLGSKNSGIVAHVKGWHSGAEVHAQYNAETEQDEFIIYYTGGSNARTGKSYLGKIVNGEWLPA